MGRFILYDLWIKIKDWIMSLYIGDDNKSDKVLHITQGSNTASELKSGVLPNTVFHNDLDFLTYTLYHVSSLGFWSYNYSGYNFTYEKYSSAGIAQIFTADAYYLLSSTYANVGASINWTIGFYLTSYGWASLPSTSYDDPINIRSRGNTTHFDFAYILILKPAKKITGYGAHISTSQFTVGNADLYNFQYAFNGTLNNHPSSIQIDPGLQLIDSSKISGSVSITASVTDGVTISKGGYPIIKSTGNYLAGTGVTTVYTKYLDNTDVLLDPVVINNVYVIEVFGTKVTVTAVDGLDIRLNTVYYIDYNYEPDRTYYSTLNFKVYNGNMYLAPRVRSGWEAIYGWTTVTLERFTTV